MPLTLLLTLPDQPRVDAATPAAWSLLDNDGARLREGVGELAGIPRADRLVALVPASHLLYLETALPPVAPAKRDALLRYAIEDKLTIDPATVHAVVLGRAADGQHVVAAIDRSWLAAVLAWLAAAGMAPHALVPAAARLSPGEGEWALDLAGHHGYAVRPDGFVYSFDLDGSGAPPFALTLALDEARRHGRAPRVLLLPAADAARAADWQAALGIEVRASLPADDTRAGDLLGAARSHNLLTGEFAPRHAREGRALFRPAAALAAAIVLVHVGFTVAEASRLDRARRALEDEMAAVFKSAFPSAQAIVDAPLQMRRNLAALRRERGLEAADEPRALLGELAGVVASLPPGRQAISRLEAKPGEAALSLTLASPADRAALAEAVAGVPGATLDPADPARPTAARLVLRRGGPA